MYYSLRLPALQPGPEPATGSKAEDVLITGPHYSWDFWIILWLELARSAALHLGCVYKRVLPCGRGR
jgi:hypothetical protein